MSQFRGRFFFLRSWFLCGILLSGQCRVHLTKGKFRCMVDKNGITQDTQRRMSSIEVLALYQYNNRKLALLEDTLDSLRNKFMKMFDDVIPSDVQSTSLRFQKFDPRFHEWVDMTNDEKICDGDKITVKFQNDLPNVPRSIIGAPPHVLSHDTTYRVWSLVSRNNCFLRNKSDRTIKCSGSVASNQGVLLDNIKAKDVSVPTHKLYRLELQVPNTPTKLYVITGVGANQDINVQEVDASSPPNTSVAKFQPEYFYAFTRFRCSRVSGKNDLYLASDENGRVTLAKGGPSRYPNPATLFMITEII